MKIDWFTFAMQILNFAVLVFLLHRFLYGPISRAMRRREEAIASRLQEADLQQQLAQAQADEYRGLSEQFEQQRTGMLERVRAESEAARQSLFADARSEVQTRRGDWLQSLHREQNNLINMVRQRASQQVVAVSRGALSQLADMELEAQTISVFLRQLDQLPNDQVERIKEEAAQGNQAQIRTAFDASPQWKQQLRDVLRDRFALQPVTFVTLPDLVCGIELHVGGSKIGWSMQDYLESLTDELQGPLAREQG